MIKNVWHTLTTTSCLFVSIATHGMDDNNNISAIEFTEQDQQTIIQSMRDKQGIHAAIEAVKNLGDNNKQWSYMLSDKELSGKIINTIYNHYYSPSLIFMPGHEQIALMLNTRGAYRWCADYIVTHEEAQETLHTLLMDMAHWEKPDLSSAENIVSLLTSIKNPTDEIDNNAYAHPASEPLIGAARSGTYAYAQFLLDNGAEVNYKTREEGTTALMNAACMNERAIAELLLSRQADINSKNNNGDTALMLAASWGNLEMVQLLLEYGAQVHIINDDGENALKKAQERSIGYKVNYNAIIELLQNAEQQLPMIKYWS
jgi:Ankyrin repeats (3 copies)